jgi:hypothetical protein
MRFVPRYYNQDQLAIVLFSRVEAGKNTSTAVPASLMRRRRGNTVSDETVMYGYWSSVA